MTLTQEESLCFLPKNPNTSYVEAFPFLSCAGISPSFPLTTRPKTFDFYTFSGWTAWKPNHSQQHMGVFLLLLYTCVKVSRWKPFPMHDIPSGDFRCNSHHHHYHPSTTGVDGIFKYTCSQSPRFAIAVLLGWLHSAHWARARGWEMILYLPAKNDQQTGDGFPWVSKREVLVPHKLS